MTDLNGPPLNLGIGASVFAKVIAYNVIGNSIQSLAGNGAIVKFTVLPDAPLNLARNNLLTSPTQITLTWQAGPSNGGYPVLDYSVFSD